MKRHSIEEVISRFVEVHKGKYIYDKFEYVGNHTRSIIICPDHGEFYQSASKHKMGQGCRDCKSFKGRDYFISKFNDVHDNKYDYSLNGEIDSYTILKIICPSHGIFEQKSSIHTKSGCKYCSNNKINHIDDVISKFSEKWGDRWDYSKFEYKGSNVKSIIICRDHGEFYHTPYKHSVGLIGCNACSMTKSDSKYYLIECGESHNNKYDYSKSKFDLVTDKIKIICPSHGEFEQVAYYHKQGSGCPVCNSSKGEKIIDNFLNGLGIYYEREFRFEECLSESGNRLRFDFYIPSENVCIEYDGEQHYTIVDHWGGEDGYNSRVSNDKVKNEFCRDNCIKLIRIPFYEKGILDILKKELNLI